IECGSRPSRDDSCQKRLSGARLSSEEHALDWSSADPFELLVTLERRLNEFSGPSFHLRVAAEVLEGGSPSLFWTRSKGLHHRVADGVRVQVSDRVGRQNP